jgi:hypothetical protein
LTKLPERGQIHYLRDVVPAKRLCVSTKTIFAAFLALKGKILLKINDGCRRNKVNPSLGEIAGVVE